WLQLAVDVRAALGIAAALHNGERGSRADWESLRRWFEGESPLDTGPVAVTLDPSSLRRDLRPFTVTLEAGGSERKFVEDLVKYWLEIGDVGLQFTWPDSGEPEFRI